MVKRARSMERIIPDGGEDDGRMLRDESAFWFGIIRWLALMAMS